MTHAVRVQRLDDLPGRQVHGMTVQEFVGRSTARGVSVYLIRLEPGAVFPPNFHKQAEEVVLVLAGAATASLGGVDHAIDEGHVIFIPAGTVHSIVAGPTGFTGFTLQTPGIAEGHDIFMIDSDGRERAL